MAREVKRMPGPKAEVTPNGLWPLAQTANVEEGGKIHEGYFLMRSIFQPMVVQ
jgi:hypothetical protein